MSKSIGEKILYFRKRAGVTQTELELELETSAGTISRIEQGQVNPTKESLLKIADSLKLSPVETSYLVGTLLQEPTAENIAAASKHFESLLDDPSVFGYMLDQFSRMQALSTGFKNLATSQGIDWQNFIGRHIVEIIFDPAYGLRNVLEPSKLGEMTLRIFAVMQQEKHFMLDEPQFTEMIGRLNKFPEFQTLWDKALEEKPNIYDLQNRKSYFNFGNGIKEAVFHPTFLYSDPRFIFYQYIFTESPLS